MKNITPLTQTESSNNKTNYQSENSLKMNEKTNKRNRAILSIFKDSNFNSNNDDDLKEEINGMQTKIWENMTMNFTKKKGTLLG